VGNKKWLAWVFPAIVVIFAIGISYFLDTGDGTPYSASSTGERGTSLIFDTLRNMGYPVRRSYRPLTTRTDTESVYVIIQPRSPVVTGAYADEMLAWVYGGGRLVYLCYRYPKTAFDGHFLLHNGIRVDAFTLYTHGSGAILAGCPSHIVNISLMENHTHGQTLQTVLNNWSTEGEVSTVFFAEYYHGFHAPQNFVGRLPLVLRLILLQTVILSIVAVWFFGKRFGNPVPYYEEIEREENEYVRALARLYSRSQKKKENE
jgi:hypothetical protein